MAAKATANWDAKGENSQASRKKVRNPTYSPASDTLQGSFGAPEAEATIIENPDAARLVEVQTEEAVRYVLAMQKRSLEIFSESPFVRP